MLTQTERRQLARIEDDLAADQRLAALSRLFATPPTPGPGRGPAGSAHRLWRPVRIAPMPATPGPPPARRAPQNPPHPAGATRAVTAARVTPTRRRAWLGLCLGVGLLAAVILTAATPIGAAALLLAPLLALALLVALTGARAAGQRARRRRTTRSGAPGQTR